jgi:hypothetical protein
MRGDRTRIPILHGFRLAFAAAKARRTPAPCSRPPAAPYIFVQKGRAIAAPCYQPPSKLMLNEVYNSRILELAGNIPRLAASPMPTRRRRPIPSFAARRSQSTSRWSATPLPTSPHQVKACALGQASSSIMARNVVGSKADELRDLREAVRRMLKENGAPPSGKWADIAVLEPVRDYKARHASTMLTFDAVTAAIDQIEAKRRAAMAAE